jgi:hypothetical protein
MNTEAILSYTNAKLVDWYYNAKKDYGVIGNGIATLNMDNEIEIHYEENGVKCLFKHYLDSEFKINTIFDIWQTEANPETDKI